MKTVVTGGGGFLGKAMVKMLRARGDDVIVVGRSAYPDVEALGAVCVKADVADLKAMKDVVADADVVFHVAAKAGVWGKAADYDHANIDGTQNVIDACLARQVKHLVHTSSPSVTFDGGDAVNADERLPYPATHLYHYGRTKAEAERRVLAANAQPHLRGPSVLLTTALRPHIIYGPGDPHILPRMIARHRQGRLRIVGDGTNKIDVTYVENGAHAHLLAADALAQNNPKNAGKAYFISDGHPVVPWQWLNRMFAGLDLPPLTKRVPYGVARAVGALMEGAWGAFSLAGEPPMTRFVAAQLGTSHFYNLANARNDIGYEPLVDPDAAIAQTLPWLKAEIAAGRL